MYVKGFLNKIKILVELMTLTCYITLNAEENPVNEYTAPITGLASP